MTAVPELEECQVDSEAFWEIGRLVDGYDRMELAGKCGWAPVSRWGRDGWDLLEWPYYVAYVRNVVDPGRRTDIASRERLPGLVAYQLATNCEGDTEVWSFPTSGQRERAIDALAFWHWKHCGAQWVEGLSEPTEVTMGPFSWARLDGANLT